MSKLKETLQDNCYHSFWKNQLDNFDTSYFITSAMMFAFAPVTVTLNGITLYVFWKEKRVKTVADILLCFLTTTDIIGGLVAMPSFGIGSILRGMNIGNPCSIFLIRTQIGMFSVDITLITSILILLDRYYAIFYPYSYQIRKNRTGVAVVLLVSLWCICAAICSLSTITSKNFLAIAFTYTTVTSFVFLSIWIHMRILIQVRRSQKDIAFKIGHLNRNKCKIKSWYRRKGTRITAVILCGIFLCYAPKIITGNLMKHFSDARSYKIAFYWTVSLMLLNSFMNPLVYIWQMKWFRNALRKIISNRTTGDENTNQSGWQFASTFYFFYAIL